MQVYQDDSTAFNADGPLLWVLVPACASVAGGPNPQQSATGAEVLDPSLRAWLEQNA